MTTVATPDTRSRMNTTLIMRPEQPARADAMDALNLPSRRGDSLHSPQRPILFSAPMVRALLYGSKTQTRRVVKPQPPAHMNIVRHLGDGDWQFVNDVHTLADSASTWRCPYGQPGDRLYVRETWAAPHAYDHLPPRLIPKDARIHYAATEDRGGLLWRPSIHMPRWASRITLEITCARVERLQDISEQNAWAEGCEGFDDDVSGGKSGYQEYAELWEQINGQGSWNANPWVWVIEFKRVKP